MSSFLDLSLLLDTLRGPTGYRLLLALLHFIWQGFAIAVVIGVALRLMRRRRAQFRYLIGLIGLAAMAVTPVVSALWIEPPVARAPDVLTLRQDELRVAPISKNEENRVEIPPPAFDGDAESVPAQEPRYRSPLWIRPLLLENLRTRQPYFLFAWLLGMSLFALRLAIGAHAIRWLSREAKPLPETRHENLSRIAQRLNVSLPHVLVSERVVEVVALGLVRPMILLPASWMLRIPSTQLEAILAHEIAHLRRHDLWINFAQRVLETLLFYHPAVWWLNRRVRLEREYCCDEIAARALNDRAAYARALEFVASERLHARRLGTFDTLFAVTMGDHEMALLNRVRKVLGEKPLPNRHPLRWTTGAVLAIPLSLWTFVIAGELQIEGAKKPPVQAPSASQGSDAKTPYESTVRPTVVSDVSTEADREARQRDEARIQQLKVEIEAKVTDINSPESYRLGIEPTRQLLDSLETAYYRQRVYLSLGDISKLLKEDEDALNYFRLGLEEDRNGHFAQSLRMKISEMLLADGQLEEAKSILQVPTLSDITKKPQSPDSPNVRPNKFDIYELRDHANVAIRLGNLDEAIQDFKLGIELYPKQTKALGDLATTLGGGRLTVGTPEGKAAREQFYTDLTTQVPTLLDSELLCSNMVVSAQWLDKKELLLERIARYEERFPDSKNIPYFLVWAAEATEGAERAAYWKRIATHPKSTKELVEAARQALKSN